MPRQPSPRQPRDAAGTRGKARNIRLERSRDLTKPAPGKANQRLSPTARLEKLRKKQKHEVLPLPDMLPVTRVYACFGWLFLLPASLMATFAFIRVLGTSLDHAVWRTPPFWFFGLGLLMWLVCFFAMPQRPVRLYVFGHEMTHALATMLCGGRVESFHVSDTGGHIISDRNNFFIALAPYFVPLFTVVAVILFFVAGAFFDLTTWVALPWVNGLRPFWALFWLIGFTWGFHLTFTVWMLVKGQSDIRFSGATFSLLLIFLVNLLIITGLLLLASPQVSGSDWIQHVTESVRRMLEK